MSAGAFPLGARELDSAPEVRAAGPTIAPATAADHAAIYHFLDSLGEAPSPAEFKASNEAPFYRPRDRLVARDGARIVAHLHVRRHNLQLAAARVPAAVFGPPSVATRYRDTDLAERLLRAAETQAAAEGVVLGLLRAAPFECFERLGWIRGGEPQWSVVSTAAFRARLWDEGWPRRLCRGPWIRPLRRWEIPALRRLYAENLPRLHGAPERSDAYWQWLVDRRAFDQFYVALRRGDDRTLDAPGDLLGYAVTRGGTIVELLTAPGRTRAAIELVARVSGDAVEQGWNELVMYLASPSPIDALVSRAGGRRRSGEWFGRWTLLRLVNPRALVRALSKTLWRRARRAGLPSSVELALAMPGRPCCLRVGPRGARLARCFGARDWIRVDPATLARMLLGQFDWQSDDARRAIAGSGAAAIEIARALLPPLGFHRPPLDDLEAR